MRPSDYGYCNHANFCPLEIVELGSEWVNTRPDKSGEESRLS